MTRAEYQRQYRAANRERLNAARAARAQKPGAKERRRTRLKRPDVRIRERARLKAWKEANRDRVNEYFREWRKRYPERARAISRAGSANRRAKQKEAGTVPTAVLEAIRVRNQCALDPSHEGPFEIDHVVPISKGGPHRQDNLQLLCWSCNRKKSATLPQSYLEHFCSQGRCG